MRKFTLRKLEEITIEKIENGYTVTADYGWNKLDEHTEKKHIANNKTELLAILEKYL